MEDVTVGERRLGSSGSKEGERREREWGEERERIGGGGSEM